MKKIIMNVEECETIGFGSIDIKEPIFAKRDGKLCGMVMLDDRGWILRIGGTSGAHGYFKTIKECLNRGAEFNYTFYTE